MSSYAWQMVKREDNNHRVPLHLFGRYEVPTDGSYEVELMGRCTLPSTIAIEKAERVTSVPPARRGV